MARLLAAGGLEDWEGFRRSWADLGLDTYMADGGRYRRRRFACFSVSRSGIRRKPHQPHYQSRDYNPLNGGIERWFEPMRDEVAAHAALQAVLRTCFALFDPLTPEAVRPADWHAEVHQFRIEARAEEPGLPTPEGMHRDGVDWVFVLLIERHNVARGTTTVLDSAGQPLGSFTLTSPMDAALVDDARVVHGVTPIVPDDPSCAAHRDVLVVTLRRP
ncbi:2OG-Fe dioxygenase family protein [Azospirillum sp. sgz302134]